MLAFSQKLLRNQFALNDVGTTPIAFRKTGIDDTDHIVNWGVGVTSGEVTIEKADREDYAGTWAPVSVVTFSGTAPKEDYVQAPGPAGAYRHRITQIVTDGTVTSKITATEPS